MSKKTINFLNALRTKLHQKGITRRSQWISFSNNQNLTMIFPIGYDIEEKELETENLNKEEIANIYEDFKILISLLDRTEGDSYDKGELQFTFSVAENIIENYIT